MFGLIDKYFVMIASKKSGCFDVIMKLVGELGEVIGPEYESGKLNPEEIFDLLNR